MGFSAEVSDFLGAAQSTYKLLNDSEYKTAQTKYTQTQEEKMRKEMEDPLNEEMKQAQLADIKSRTAHRGAALALQRDFLKQSQAEAAARAAAPAGNYQPRGGPTFVPGAGPAAVGTDDDTYALQKAKGGMVRKFADGGYADDEDDDEDVTPQVMPPAIGGGATMPPPQAAAPAPQAPPPAIGGATDFSAQSRQKGQVPIPIPRSTAIQALNDGQKYGVSLFGGNGAVPSSSRQRGLKAYAQGAGAASPDEMVYLYRKIDPDGTMPESQRNMLAVGALYDYKMKAGDPQGAARAAFQATQYYRSAARNYAALGVAAMQGGEIEPALKLFMKSYANIPDGNDMKLWQGKNGQIGVQVTGPDGKVIKGGLVPPDQVMGAAMGIASGAGFDEALAGLAAGGQPGGRGGAVGGGRKKAGAAEDDTPVGIGSEKGNITPAASAEIRNENKQAIDAFVTAQNAKNDKTHLGGLFGSKKEVTDDERNTMTNLLYHLRRNNDLTPEEGINVIQRYISAPASEKEGKPTMKVIRDDEAKTRTIQFNDGQSFTMPTSDYAQWATARGEAAKQRADAAKKSEDEAAKPKSNVTGALIDYATSPSPSHAARTGNQAPTGPYNPRVGQYGQPTAPAPDETPAQAIPTSGAAPAPTGGAPNYNPRMGGSGRGAIPFTAPAATPEPPPARGPYQQPVPPQYATPAPPTVPYNPRLGQYGE